MTRESKMTFRMVGPDSCNIICEMRNDGGKWEYQGTAPRRGSMDKLMAEKLEAYERFGWTPYDRDEPNVLRFWKEL